MTMASERSAPQTISRQALGRIARLGDLYDASTEQFCGVSIFHKQLPPDSPAISKTDNPQSDIKFTVASSLQEKFDNLNISGEIKLSILGGLCKVTGSAKYLSQEKKSFKSVESTLVYDVKTVTEHLELSYKEVQEYISEEKTRYSGAIYVVTEIEWGANCMVKVTDQNRENKSKQEVEGNLKLEVEKLKALVSNASTEASAEMKQKMTEEWKKFSLEIFGDLIPDGSDEFPQTFAGSLALMRKVPELIHGYNKGKGKPLSYIMLPLSHLRVTAEKPFPSIVTLGTKGVKIVHLFDRITEFRQKVYDQFEELSNYRHCVTAVELEDSRGVKEDLEVLRAGVQEQLASLLEQIRSGKEDAGSLDAFCKNNMDTATVTFHKCNEIYEGVQARIEFVKRCERFGAEYLAPPVDQRIASACNDYDNVYVLFHGDAYDEKRRRNESAFITLAKESTNENKTVCYFTWSRQSGNVRIEHFRKGEPVHADVAKQLETKNMAKCVPAARRAFCLMPFNVRCPGSYDGECSREKKSWTCVYCNETLQFCPGDNEVYCSCGHSSVNGFQFRCHSDAHGSDFTQFRQETLQNAVDHISVVSKSKYTKYNYGINMFNKLAI